MEKKRMFDKPMGESKYHWNNLPILTTGPVVCELCGTEWPALPLSGPENYHPMKFLGSDTIEECCGKAADILYGEFGEKFAQQFLCDFAENPTNPRFKDFLITLNESLTRAKVKAQEPSEKTQELHRLLTSMLE